MSIWGYRVAALSIILTFGSLGTFVYLRNPRSRLYQDCFFFSLFVCLWTLGFFLTMFADIGHDIALFCSRLSHAFGVIIPVVFLRFALSLIGREKEKTNLLKINYVITAILSVGYLATPLFIDDVQPKLSFPHYPVAGPLYIVFIVYWLSLAGYAHYLLFLDYRQNQGHRRQQIKYFFLGQIIAWGGAFLLFPLIFGIKIDPATYILLPIYSILTTYAIVRHQLLDIEVVIRRTAVFAGLFAFVYGVFTIFTVLGQSIFRNALGWSQWLTMVPTVLIITFALKPLENFLTDATEKFLFQKKYDYRDLLKTFTNEVLTVLDLQKLIEQTIIELNKIIKLESASMLLFQKDSKNYRLASSLGIRDKDLKFGDDNAIVQYLKQINQPILKDKAADEMDGHSHLKEDFKRLNAQLCIPITLHDEMIGILSLGMKKSGEEFTQEDIDILMTLARTLAIAIANAQLFDELSKTQADAAQREKMAVIGTLAAGMALEIKNPITTIKTFTEYLPERYDDPEFRIKFQRIVSSEAARISRIVNELLVFSKPAEPKKKEVLIVELLNGAMELFNMDFVKQNIRVEWGKSEDCRAFVDRGQIWQVLTNLIQNAVHAVLNVNRERILHFDVYEQNSRVILNVKDNGCGIPPSMIPHLFDPFFSGKENGTGLGLATSYSLIEKNGGKISVQSQEGQGAMFSVILPSA